MLLIFSMPVLIRHLRQLKTVVFLPSLVSNTCCSVVSLQTWWWWFWFTCLLYQLNGLAVRPAKQNCVKKSSKLFMFQKGQLTKRQAHFISIFNGCWNIPKDSLFKCCVWTKQEKFNIKENELTLVSSTGIKTHSYHCLCLVRRINHRYLKL
jgi:hypothetical protein